MSVTQTRMPDQVDSSLRWRCRRGMLELDILLNQYLDNEYEATTDEQKIVFDQFLDYPDQLLFDLLLGYQLSSDTKVSALVQTIRQSVTA